MLDHSSECYARDLYGRDFERITIAHSIRASEITEHWITKGLVRSSLHFQEQLANIIEEGRELAHALIEAHVRAHRQGKHALDPESWRRISDRVRRTCFYLQEERGRVLMQSLKEWQFGDFRKDLEPALRRDIVMLVDQLRRDIRIRRFECRDLVDGSTDGCEVPDDPHPVEFPGIGGLPVYRSPSAPKPFNFGHPPREPEHRKKDLASIEVDSVRPTPPKETADENTIRARLGKRAERVLPVWNRLRNDSREFIRRSDLQGLDLPPTSVDADIHENAEPGDKVGGPAGGGGKVEFRRTYLLDFVGHRWAPRRLPTHQTERR